MLNWWKRRRRLKAAVKRVTEVNRAGNLVGMGGAMFPVNQHTMRLPAESRIPLGYQGMLPPNPDEERRMNGRWWFT